MYIHTNKRLTTGRAEASSAIFENQEKCLDIGIK